MHSEYDGGQVASANRSTHWRMAAVSVAFAAMFAIFSLVLPGCTTGQADSQSSVSAASQASESGSGELARASMSGETANSASAASSASSSASQSVGGAASSRTSEKVDARSFDAHGNPTLSLACELSGEKLLGELEAGGYKWSDGARTWMSSTGALIEIQGESGLLTCEDIARLAPGAKETAAVFVITASGYDTPEAALDGLSSNVTIRKSHVNSAGDVVFAVARNSGRKDFLIAVTKMDDAQQTLLVFTEDAVEDGLFAEVTDISSVKSIEGLWKALGVQDN